MGLYSTSRFPVSPEIEKLHERELETMSKTGTWWRAGERHDIALSARAARVAAGTQAAAAEAATVMTAPAPALTVARELADGGAAIDADWYAARRAEGLGEEEYVETVGVVARLAQLDVFARAIGLPPAPLAAPAANDEPPSERPAEAIDEGFYTASIPAGEAGGDTGRRIYGTDYKNAANILRSLSLVPAEARRLNIIAGAQYMTLQNLLDFGYSPFPTLSRPQLELVAAKVSAINQCFY